VDLRVRETAEPIHGAQETSVLKEAVLENGVEILVPQFVRQGDVVRVEVESSRYLDRVR
jgi:elongation factor P